MSSMRIESPGKIGRAAGKNRHLQREYPLYALTDPTPPGTPSIRAAAGGPMRLTSRVSTAYDLLVAHDFTGEFMSIVDASMFTDFGVRIAYENPEYATERFFARVRELPTILILEDHRRCAPLPVVCD